MPEESVHSSPPWSRTTKAIMASAALILLALAIWRFSDFIAPIATAVILAYLLNPLINFIQKKITVSRGRAVLVVYVVIILLLVGGGFAIAIATAQQTADLVENLPDLLVTAVGVVQREAREVWNTDLALGPFQVNPATSLSQLDARNAVNQLLGMLEPVLTRSGTLAASVAQAAARFASLALLVFALSIYVARDFPKIGRAISDFAQQPGYRHDADRLLKDFARIWDAYLRGQVVLGLTIGAVVTISLLILGVNNALGLGALAGLLEFLPIVGPLISALAVILVTLFQGSHIWGLSPLWHALIVGIVMLLIQQLENNILVPRIVGKALDLHPLITMVAVLMGASLA
ncbi:MAG: AI-2E family transporter, partial [Caldilineaceae bacterium]|nr:AI-2E family transporter [Caldilineaceae bacterium]